MKGKYAESTDWQSHQTHRKPPGSALRSTYDVYKPNNKPIYDRQRNIPYRKHTDQWEERERTLEAIFATEFKTFLEASKSIVFGRLHSMISRSKWRSFPSQSSSKLHIASGTTSQGIRTTISFKSCGNCVIWKITRLFLSYASLFGDTKVRNSSY